MSTRISEAERRFLVDGVAQGIRTDGRGCFDYRRISFEMGVVPSAVSSCKFQTGETDILVGVKCELVKPRRDSLDAGNFTIVVDVAPSVSKKVAEGANSDDWGRNLSVLIESLCAGDHVIDRPALCVLPGVFAWEVYVDVVVLASGGNLLDSISLCLVVVLSQTLLPRVQVLESLEEGEQMQLKVDDRPENGIPFPLKKMPLCVTVAQFDDKFLLDVTAEEESCADAMMCVVVDARSGDIMGLSKLGRGLFNPNSLPSMFGRCRATAAALVQQFERVVPLKAQAV